MDVILDLHWSDRGVLGSCPPGNGCQQLMPDANSLTFWSEVAARYQERRPRDCSSSTTSRTTSPGTLAERRHRRSKAGPRSACSSSTTPCARRAPRTWWSSAASTGPTTCRACRPTASPATTSSTRRTRTPTPAASRAPPSDWGRAFGSLTATDPVIATEFGVLQDTACTTDYDQQLIAYVDAHFAGLTAWAWYPGGCTFPALINDWAGTPSPTGAVVKAALLGYPDDPPASPPRPPGPRRQLHLRSRPAGLGLQPVRRSVAPESGRAPAGGRRRAGAVDQRRRRQPRSGRAAGERPLHRVRPVRRSERELLQPAPEPDRQGAARPHPAGVGRVLAGRVPVPRQHRSIRSPTGRRSSAAPRCRSASGCRSTWIWAR